MGRGPLPLLPRDDDADENFGRLMRMTNARPSAHHGAEYHMTHTRRANSSTRRGDAGNARIVFILCTLKGGSLESVNRMFSKTRRNENNPAVAAAVQITS